MNLYVRLAMICILLNTAIQTSRLEAQVLEQRVVADMKALGYNVEKTEDGKGYNVTENGGLYDDNTLWLYVSVYKRGAHDFVSVIAPVVRIDEAESENILKTSTRLISRNVYVPCANYGAYYSEDMCYFNLARVIESGCYSKGLIGGVISCMKSELLEQASDARGYQLNKSELDEVNQQQLNLIRGMNTTGNRGKK